MSRFTHTTRSIADLKVDIAKCEARIKSLSMSERRFIHSCNFTVLQKGKLLTQEQDDWLKDIASRFADKAKF